MIFIFKKFEIISDVEIKSKIDLLWLNVFIIFFLLFPISLLSGPFLPDLTISLGAIFFFYLTLKYKLFHFYKNPLVKILLFFWFYIITSSLFSENIIFSLRSSFFYIRFLLFSLFVFFLIKSYKPLIKYFFYVLSFAFFFVLVDSFYQFYFDVSLTGFEKPKLRLTGPFDDRQIVGSFISRLLPLYLFMLYYLNFKLNYKFILFITLLSILVLISGERTAFFLLSLSIFLFFILFSKKLLNFILFFIGYILFSLLIVFSNSDLKERIIYQTLQGTAIKQYSFQTGEEEYFKNKPSKGFYVFSRAHEAHYLTALKMFKDEPLIGKGPNMFRKLCSDKKFFIEQSSCTTHPHNFLIQIMAETGIIGMFFYLLIFFHLIKKIIFQIYFVKLKQLKLLHKEKKLFILNVGFLINSFLFIVPNGNFFNNYLNAIIFIPFGFYLYQLNNDY